MKNSWLKFSLPLLLLVLGIYSCKDDDNDPPLIKPSISELSPGEGPIRTAVTVRGISFGSNPIVKFGTTTATVTGSTSTSITTSVPDGLSAGPIEVTVDNDGSVSDGEVFTVTEGDGTDGGGTDGGSTVADTVVALDELSSLETALKAADGDLVTVLSGDGPFTLFAPNNAAFDALIAALEADDLAAVAEAVGSDGLQQVLLAHVVSGTLGSAQLTADTVLTTANDSSIVVGRDGETVTVNGAAVVTPDIQVSNGVVHIIDSVINLPVTEGGEEMGSTVTDSIAANDELSTLTLALKAAGLDEALRGDGPFTVFAPNDGAFTDLLAALELNDLDEVIAELGEEGVADLLRAHVIAGSFPSDQLMAQEYETLNPGQTLTVTTTDDSVFVNGAGVLRADILASNGVIHIIDSVVNQTEEEMMGVGTAIAEDEALDSLEVALTLAGLVDTLNEQSAQYTVFAPNNTAFQAALTTFEVTTVAELVAALEAEEEGSASNLLLGHIVTGITLVGELTDGQTLTALNGSTLTVALDENGVSINGIPVVDDDNTVPNGVVHTINGVILPQ